MSFPRLTAMSYAVQKCNGTPSLHDRTFKLFKKIMMRQGTELLCKLEQQMKTNMDKCLYPFALIASIFTASLSSIYK